MVGRQRGKPFISRPIFSPLPHFAASFAPAGTSEKKGRKALSSHPLPPVLPPFSTLTRPRHGLLIPNWITLRTILLRDVTFPFRDPSTSLPRRLKCRGRKELGPNNFSVTSMAQSSLSSLLCRLRLRGQAPGDAVAQPRGVGQAQHRDEADDLRLRAEGGDEGARPHRVLGQPDHLLRRRPKLPEGLLLDLPVSRQVPPSGALEIRECARTCRGRRILSSVWELTRKMYPPGLVPSLFVAS